MNITKISNKYIVKKLGYENVEDIYNLSITNPQYFYHCPPMVTYETIKDDLYATPNNCSIENKFYLGFYENEKLIAILDLILNYPDKDTSYIGLFMVDSNFQGKNIGTNIISGMIEYLKLFYDFIKLGYVSTNVQSKNFWEKQGFDEVDVVEQELYKVVRMVKKIN